ncbi:hypothetical protein FBZ84_12554 [Azospirillum baldaniorum]|nr:hypothetical protein FBZ84_12554 [Azospirillum baldaniorum]
MCRAKDIVSPNRVSKIQGELEGNGFVEWPPHYG